MHSAIKRLTQSSRLPSSWTPCNTTLQVRLSTAVITRSFIAGNSGHGVIVRSSSSIPSWNTPRSNSMRSSRLRHFSSYPNHTVVPMPALSPTMETGSVVRWTLKEVICSLLFYHHIIPLSPLYIPSLLPLYSL
jgi:hypothetical protein